MRRNLTLALALIPAALGATPMQPTFSAKREAVRVDVLATSNGQPLTGLQAADFEVRDNGILQHVELATFEEIPLNVILTLDMSASVAGERLWHLQRAGTAVLNALKRDDRAALLTFNHVVAQPAALTTEFHRVREALENAEGHGETSLRDGIYAGLVLSEGDIGRSLVMVFSDGLDTRSWLSSEMVLDTARRSNAVVYSVSRGQARDDDLLKDLGETTGGGVFETESAQDLEATFLRILDEFRHRYLISYSPTGVEVQGWHRLDVRVKRRNATVRARQGYFKEPAF